MNKHENEKCGNYHTHKFLSKILYFVHNREEKLLSHVAMVAKFLGVKKSGSALFQTSSILFTFIKFVKCWRNFLG